ncbi:MAG: putative 2-dehydropantoate 2-reductase [Algisphaera sp.]
MPSHNTSPLTYAVVGTGALGGYYGGMLAQKHGDRVRFLLRSDVNHVRAHGLRVETKNTSFTLPNVQAFNNPAVMPPVDVALLCLKTTHNAQLANLLPLLLNPNGVVLVLQNGLHPEADAAAVVGDDRVLGGLCFLCANKIGPGHVRHLDYGQIRAGAPHTASPTTQALLPRIAQDFSDAQLDLRVVDNLRLARWQKLVWNIPFNGLSVVLNQTTDAMMASPAIRTQVKSLMAEVVTAAHATEGCVIEPTFVQKMLDDTQRMPPYRTSMMLDADAKRPLEFEAIVGDPLRAATRAGLAMPEMTRLYAQLKAFRPMAGEGTEGPRG